MRLQEITITYRGICNKWWINQTVKYSDTLTLVPPQENGEYYICNDKTKICRWQMERGNIASLFDHSQKQNKPELMHMTESMIKPYLLKMVGLQKLTYQ